MIEKDWLNQPPLYSCCCCVDEYSWPEENLAVYNNKTYCEICWDWNDLDTETGIEWYDLPPFKPKWEKTDESISGV